MEAYDDPRLTSVGLFVEVYAGLTRRLDAVHAAAGLAGTEFDVLIRLARSPDRRLRMSDLAAQTALSTSGITRIVDRLEARGLLARTACPADRRSSLARLTDDGRVLITAHVPALVRVIEESFVGMLDERRRDEFVSTLRTLRDELHPQATAGAGH